MSRGAIVVGAHVNGLGVVRALAPLGLSIATISTRPFDIAQHSRWVAENHRLLELHDDGDALVELLEHQAARWSGWAVYATNDDALATLAAHHERLSRWYRLTLQPWEVVSHLVEKDLMEALARRAGLALPASFGEAAKALSRSDLRSPVVVKPNRHDRLLSSYGTKLFLACDRGELAQAVERLARIGAHGLVSELIPGPDCNIYVYCVYIDAAGEPSPGVTVRKLRQNPPVIGGARAAEVAADIPELREATVELLRRAGFRGMAFAEFKRDARTGQFSFIEVNGRAVLFNSILPPTGIDLVRMAWSDFGRGEGTGARPTGWRGTWVHLQADLRCLLLHRRSEHFTLGEWLAPYRRAKAHAVWSAADPKPLLAQTALVLRGARGGLASPGV